MTFLLLAFMLLLLLGAGGLVYTYIRREKELHEKLEQARAEKFEAEKQLEVARQRSLDMESRMKDWEAQKEEHVKSSKAAILEVSGQISSKLLEDHKREQESTRKEQEERIKQTNTRLLEQFDTVTKSVAALGEQTQTIQQQSTAVMRALTNPTGAGQLAEVGLENSLKNMGLEPGRDFTLQYSMSDAETGSRLRPDAVIFLPQDMVIVVDSKASKHLLELGEAEGEQAVAEARERLRRTMAKHLQDLTSKDYASAVQEQRRQAGFDNKVQVMLNVMYLPSESAIQHLREADKDFLARAEKAGIILAGPASLHGLFSLAKLQIASARQADNHEHIIASVSNLLESVSIMLGHADSIGSGLQKAAKSFNDMARSVNQRVLSRMQRLVDLGVTPAKNKALPKRLMTYDLRRMDDVNVMEIEDIEEAQDEAPLLPSSQKEAAD